MRSENIQTENERESFNSPRLSATHHLIEQLFNDACQVGWVTWWRRIGMERRGRGGFWIFLNFLRQCFRDRDLGREWGRSGWTLGRLLLRHGGGELTVSERLSPPTSSSGIGIGFDFFGVVGAPCCTSFQPETLFTIE
jgi:hypothetical protein